MIRIDAQGVGFHDKDMRPGGFMSPVGQAGYASSRSEDQACFARSSQSFDLPSDLVEIPAHRSDQCLHEGG